MGWISIITGRFVCDRHSWGLVVSPASGSWVGIGRLSALSRLTLFRAAYDLCCRCVWPGAPAVPPWVNSPAIRVMSDRWVLHIPDVILPPVARPPGCSHDRGVRPGRIGGRTGTPGPHRWLAEPSRSAAVSTNAHRRCTVCEADFVLVTAPGCAARSLWLDGDACIILSACMI